PARSRARSTCAPSASPAVPRPPIAAPEPASIRSEWRHERRWCTRVRAQKRTGSSQRRTPRERSIPPPPEAVHHSCAPANVEQAFPPATVGRTLSSAPDPLVRLFGDASLPQQPDLEVRRKPGGLP